MKYSINSKIYYDSDGNSVTLIQLVEMNPSWAVNRILHLEETLGNLLNDCINFDDGNLTSVFQEEASQALGFSNPILK